HPRVTHPFATLLIPFGTFAFDLHVLGTPPALILSQDQTLMLKASGFHHRRTCALLQQKPQLFNARPIYLALRCFGSISLMVAASCRSPNRKSPINRFRSA